MAGAGRNRKTTLNIPFRIQLLEICYPGHRFVPIKNKYVYVLNGAKKPVLVDEIYIRSPRQWRRTKAKDRAKYRTHKSGCTVPMTGGGYTPLHSKLYNDNFYFYLSPHPLGEEAVELMIRRTVDDEQYRRDIKTQFDHSLLLSHHWQTKLIGVATFGRESKGDFHVKTAAQVIGWENNSSCLKGYTSKLPFTTVRAAFNFDPQGQRVKNSFGFRNTSWGHVVILQDAEAWLEGIHEHGVVHALNLLARYRADEKRHKMRVIATSICKEIEDDKKRSEKKKLEDELFSLPKSQSENLKDYLARDVELRKRVGWKHRYVVHDKKRRGVRHKVEVDRKKWLEMCYRSQSPNAAALYLNLDDLRAAAYIQNAEKFVIHFEEYMLSRPHEVLCASHVYATQKTKPPKQDAVASAEENIAAMISTRGAFHWALTLDRLNETVSGRRLLTELTNAANKAKTEADKHYYSLPRALTDSSQAFWTKKLWDNTGKRAFKSFCILAVGFMGGVLDKTYIKRTPNALENWFDRQFSRAVGKKVKIAEKAARKKAEIDALRKRLNTIGKPKPAKGRGGIKHPSHKPSPEIYEDYIVEAKGKVLRESIEPWLMSADALITLVDAINGVWKLTQGKGNERDVVYVGEATAKTLVVLTDRMKTPAKPPIVPPAGIQSNLSPEVVKQWKEYYRRTKLKNALLRLKLAGRLLGLVGACLDIHIAMKGARQARHPGVTGGYLLQATGASVGLYGTLYAYLSGVALSGTLGLIVAGCYFVFYIAGQIMIWIWSFAIWRKATRKCFLGKDIRGKKIPRALINLDSQYQKWLAIYASFRAVLTKDLKLEIKAGSLAKGDRFHVEISTAQRSSYSGSSRSPKTSSLSVLGAFDLIIDSRRGITHDPYFTGPLLAEVYHTQVGADGWTSEIEVNLKNIDLNQLDSIEVSITLYSGIRNLTMPGRRKPLTLALGRYDPPRRQGAWPLQSSGLADVDGPIMGK